MGEMSRLELGEAPLIFSPKDRDADRKVDTETESLFREKRVELNYWNLELSIENR